VPAGHAGRDLVDLGRAVGEPLVFIAGQDLEQVLELPHVHPFLVGDVDQDRLGQGSSIAPRAPWL